MLVDRKGKMVSPLDGPSQDLMAGAGVPTGPVTVHGFEFIPDGTRWDARQMRACAGYVCREIHAELIDNGPHWSCWMMQRAHGTGDSAEQAFEAAYRALDAKSDAMIRVLNAVHERAGLTT
jgi:hypothetical protein